MAFDLSKRGNLDDSQAKDLIERRVDLHGESAARRPFNLMMLRQRAMYFGKHHFIQDERTGRLKDPVRVSPLRTFYKANLMLGDIVRAMLTVTGARGEFVVPPIDGSRRARHAAWVSTKLFEHISHANRMSELDRLATAYAAIDGSVTWKTSWEQKAGRGEPRRYYWAGSTPASGVLWDPDEATRAAKEEAGEFDDLWTGDVVLEVVPMLQCEWDWAARETGYAAADWACTKTLVTLDYIEEHYGLDARKRVRPEDVTQGALYYNEAISFMASSFGAPIASWDDDNRDRERVMLVDYWERAKSLNRRLGRNIHYAGGEILKNIANPYRVTKHEIPLEKQDWIMAPGRFIGISLAEQLANPQHQYNASRGNLIEHQRVFGHPAIFVPKDSGIPTGQYAIQPGMVYAKNQTAGKVEFGPSPPTPDSVLQNAEIARNEMAQISSQQSLDGSKMPGQLRSGDALETIFAERNKGMIEPAENFLSCKARVGQQGLELAHRFYPDEQVIQYVGDDRKFRVLSFKRVDVHADMRVMIDRGKILASPAAAKSRMMEAVSAGALDPTNPDHQEAIWKVLEFQTADELISDRLQEEENQERELEEMTSDPLLWIEERADMMAPAAFDEGTGELAAPPAVQGYPVNPWDDHRAHARVSLRFIRSEEFRNLDPVAKSLVIQHWQAHDAEVKKAQMQELMLQEMLRGGAGEKGKPSQPKLQAAS